MKAYLLFQSLIAATAVLPHAAGFVSNFFSHPSAVDGLLEMAEAQKDVKLECLLKVETEKGAQMALQGLSLEFHEDRLRKGHHTWLPGVDGPHPKTSSGRHEAEIVSSPYFIDLNGKQTVSTDNGCWEIVWHDGGICGALICSLNVGEEVRNRGAVLPKGQLLLSFSLWTQEGLAVEQARKFEVEQRLKKIHDEKQLEIKKYTSTSNVLMKAFHFRNLAALSEKADYAGIRSFKHVPDSSGIVALPNGLLMNREGSLWRKEDSFFGQKNSVVGKVSVKQVFKDDETNLKP